MKLASAPEVVASGHPRHLYTSPTDSTRSLLGLMQLGGPSAPAPSDEEQNPLDGIISRPVMRSLWSALHARDQITVKHCRRVSQLAVVLAEYLGWEGKQLKEIEVAGLLHDIGKLGVPDIIRYKPGKLTPDEIELMSLHYNVALNVLQACRVSPVVLEMICNSHATFSGLAPSRMTWKDRSLGARILAIADAYESLNTKQTYRPARTHNEIVEILTSAAREFDSNVVSALARYVQQNGLPFATDEVEDAASAWNLSSSDEQLEASWLCHVMSQLYLLESLYDGFFVVDADLRVIVWNRGLESLVGYSVFDMLGKTWTSRLLGYLADDDHALPEQQCPMNKVLQGAGAQATEIQLKRQNGRLVRAELQTMPLLDESGRLHGAIEIVRDLTRCQRRAPQEIRELKLAASRDALTGVANRGELESQLTEFVAKSNLHPDDPFSIIFLDVDHFKSVNDSYGHAVGDQVLVDLSRLLQQDTYSGESVGRYGGEEFVILCPETDLDNAIRRAERLRRAIRESKIGGVDGLKVTSSFGVAEFKTGDSVESLLRRADEALYQAKETGRDRTCPQLAKTDDASEKADDTVKTEDADPFVFTSWFTAVIASDMVIHKLSGYVNDNGAQLGEVTPERIVLTQGSAGWFGGWGAKPESQPVEMEVHFERTPTSGPHGCRTRIGVTIKPRGRVKDAETFQIRAQQVLRELKQYFAAD